MLQRVRKVFITDSSGAAAANSASRATEIRQHDTLPRKWNRLYFPMPDGTGSTLPLHQLSMPMSLRNPLANLKSSTPTVPHTVHTSISIRLYLLVLASSSMLSRSLCKDFRDERYQQPVSENISRIIIFDTNQTLRTIAVSSNLTKPTTCLGYGPNAYHYH